MQKDTIFEAQNDAGQPMTIKIHEVANGNKWALVCSGLTGSLARQSAMDQLAATLGQNGWSSLRFDYRNSLNPSAGESLRTMKTMLEDTSHALVALSKRISRSPDVVIGRGLGARFAIEALQGYPEIPLVLWSPIVWLLKSLELRGRLDQLNSDGIISFDDTVIGKDFVALLNDPTDIDLKSWVVPKRKHIIIHGKDDKVVPYKFAEDTRDLIENAGGIVEFPELQGEHPHPEDKTNIAPQLSEIAKIVNIL